MTDRRQFIKRGGLWVTGAVAFPVIARANRVANRGSGGASSWVYVVPYAEATVDAYVAPDSLWWHTITLGAGTATKLGAKISNFVFSSSLKLGLYNSSRSKLAEVSISVSAAGDVEGAVSASVSSGSYFICGIGNAGDNNAFSVPYKASGGDLYYKAGVTPGVLPSTLPTEDGTVSNRLHAFGVYV